MAKLQLEQFLPYRLNRIASAVSQDFRSIYGPNHDLTIPEWRVLATLGQFEELSAKEIGRHSSMHKTKVSRAVRAWQRSTAWKARFRCGPWRRGAGSSAVKARRTGGRRF